MPGTLYICATPIGNLSDITVRALETLKTVDIIAAEDTRHTMKLLNAYDIKKPVTSYYEHNKTFKTEKIISMLIEGKNVALVSDAGTPVISDPGDMLVRSCIENNINVVSIPGPCAAICALTTSGIECRRFMFVGFLPAKISEKKKELSKFTKVNVPMVIYEAPHKIKSTLAAMLEIFGERYITVHREMTKKFEEILRFNLSESVEYFNNNEPRGEFVIIVEGISEVSEKSSDFSDVSIEEQVEMYIASGMDKKSAIKKCAEERNIPKREVYAKFINN